MSGITNVELLARVIALETTMKAVLDAQKEENKVLDEIREQLVKYKGFIGGIMFLVTSVFTFFKTWPYISTFFSK